MDEEQREIWEFEPHTFDDDGFPGKCRQIDCPEETFINETRKGRGDALCPSCQQTVAVVSING